MTVDTRANQGRVSIREALGGDARSIANCHVTTWRAAYHDLLPESTLAGLSTETCTQSFRRAIEAPHARSALLVATINTGLLGFAWIGPSRDHICVAGVGEVYELYLHPEHWREGIGTLLHDAACAQLIGLGFTTAILWALEGNDRAVNFYQHLGWHTDGRTKNARTSDTSDRHELRMHRRLTAEP